MLPSWYTLRDLTMNRIFLIADDSEPKTTMLKGLVHASGFDGEIVTTDTTEDALDIVEQQESIDFAFVDFYIPSENGPAIIAALRKHHPDCRIALISSADNAENFAKAERAGAETCICSTNDGAEEEIADLLADWTGE